MYRMREGRVIADSGGVRSFRAKDSRRIHVGVTIGAASPPPGAHWPYALTNGRSRIHVVATHFSPWTTAALACSEA